MLSLLLVLVAQGAPSCDRGQALEILNRDVAQRLPAPSVAAELIFCYPDRELPSFETFDFEPGRAHGDYMVYLCGDYHSDWAGENYAIVNCNGRVEYIHFD